MMKGALRYALLLIFLAASGCATVPFEKHAGADMSKADPSEVVGSFRNSLPEDVNLLSSLVFRYTFIGKVTAIGTLEADIRARKFSAVGMSPMGMKLFSVKVDDSGITERFLLPMIEEKGDLASLVAGDIWRMYYDMVPPEGARVRRSKDYMEFITPREGGYMVHVFAGPGGNLVMKKFYRRGVLRWKVGYYEYIREGGRLYPGGIVLTDRNSGYELTARLKKVYDKKN